MNHILQPTLCLSDAHKYDINDHKTMLEILVINNMDPIDKNMTYYTSLLICKNLLLDIHSIIFDVPICFLRCGKLTGHDKILKSEILCCDTLL